MRLAALALAALLLPVTLSCSDPVRDAKIAALGSDLDANGHERPLDENHRPGTPCLLCHSPGGPASGHPFVIGGTVYKTAANPIPQPNVGVTIHDAAGVTTRGDPTNTASGGANSLVTNKAGNFWLDANSVSGQNPVFPLKVAVETKLSFALMASHIGRDGSCATCHFAASNDPVKSQSEILRSVGVVYAFAVDPETPGGVGTEGDAGMPSTDDGGLGP